MAIKFDTFASTGAGGGAVTSVNTQTGAVVLSANDLAADHTASNYTASNSNIDGHLSGIDTKLGTIAAGLTYKGAFDATAGTPSLANALQGDLYIIDTAGTIYGQTWAVGDHLLINEDMGGTITNSKIDKVDNTDSVTSVNGSTGAVVVNLQSVTDQSGVTTGTVQAGILKSATVRVGTGATFYELPSADGSSNQVLATDGAGSLYFKTESAGAVSSVNTQTGAVVLSGDDLAADHTAVNYTAANANIDGHLSGIDSKLANQLESGDNVSVLTNDAGYLTAITGQNIGSLSDVTITAAATGEVLKYNGSAWVDSSVAYSEVTGTPTNVSSFTNDAGYLTAITGQNIGSLSDVTITSATNGQVLSYDGSAWVNSAASAGSLAGLSDVTITSAASGEVLKYNGSAWVDSSVAYSEVTGTPTNVSTFTNDSGYLTGITAQSIGSLSDVTITSAATGEVLRYNGSAWVDAVLAYSDLSGTPTNVSTFTNDAGYLTAITGQSIGDLSDVTITAAATGEYLRYNGSAWVDAALSIADDSSPQLAGNLDVNSNYIVSASNGDIELEPNGTGSLKIRGNATGGSGHLVLNCENNSHGVTIKGPPHSAAATYTLTLPNDDGTADQVLKTDGSGGLSWVDQASGGGWTYSAITADPANAQAGYHYSCTGSFTITLPTSGVSAGSEIRIKNMGTGTITIDPQTQNIDGATTDYTLDVQYSAITLVSTGSHWEII